MKVLITGITGFAGTSMYHLLTRMKDIDIYGTYWDLTKNNIPQNDFGIAALWECDINDAHSLDEVLNKTKPNIIFHFAAYVSVFGSFKNPVLAFQTNVIGTINLFESIKKIVPDAKILLPDQPKSMGKFRRTKCP